MLRLGLVTGTADVSARDGELILITASALPYEEMAVDDLVALAPDGAVVAGEREPSSRGWRVHVAVYAARPDAHALVHTHSEQATAWSESGEEADSGAGSPPLTSPAAPMRSPPRRRWRLWATVMRCLGGHGARRGRDAAAARGLRGGRGSRSPRQPWRYVTQRTQSPLCERNG